MFFVFFVDLGEISFFLAGFRVWRVVRPVLQWSIASCILNIFVLKLSTYTLQFFFQGRGGLSAPRPPVIDKIILMIPTPTKSTTFIPNPELKFKNYQKKKSLLRQKKWSVTRILFMNCKNSYITYGVPLAMLHSIYAEISSISEIHSSELIILCFPRFSPKKKNLRSQQKNFYTLNSSFTIRWIWRISRLFILLDGRDIQTNMTWTKMCQKCEKKSLT